MIGTTNNKRGFTLIEVMVYIALFAIIIWGGIITAYWVLESSERDRTRTMIQEEGAFLSDKIDWTLSGIQTVVMPPLPTNGQPCTEGDTLSATKWDASIGTIMIRLSDTDMTIARGGNPAMVLNNSNTTINALSFAHCSDGQVSERITANFTVSARTPRGEIITQSFTDTTFVHQ